MAVELKGWGTGWTWVWLVFGSNAIAAYMFSELLPGRAPFRCPAVESTHRRLSGGS